MSASPLPRTEHAIRDGIAAGLHLGAQLAVVHRGQLVADLALGEVRPGEPLAVSHMMLWLSASKPLAAVAIAQLWERGLLDLDDPVARFIPEFGQRGKEGVTLRHCLTHTAGFRGVATSWNPAPWEEILRRICAAPLEPGWEPGRKAGYHVASSWYVLAEVVQRLSGQRYDHYLRERVFAPLDMPDCRMAIDPAELESLRPRLAPIYHTDKGAADASYAGNTDDAMTSIRPGAGARGPANQFVRLYQMLLHRGRIPPTASAFGNRQSAIGNPQILSPQTVEALSSRHRAHLLDQTFRHEIDWGLGFVLNSAGHAPAAPYGYGPHASPRTFGHGGSQSSTAFADPEHDLAVALAFNGMPGEPAHDRRLRATLAALYEDLGLAARG